MVELRRTRSLRSREESTTVEDPKQQQVKQERKRHKRVKRQQDDDEENEINKELSLVETYAQDRPFEIISNFPTTLDPPNYNSILTHPLTIKDSAVLYNSLHQSRKTWIYNFGNIFPLYWKKEFLEGNIEEDLEEEVSNFSIKDKMQKMSDCTMLGGPHTFDIRLFILKDELIETTWQEEQDSKKKEKEQKKQDELDAKKKKTEEKIQKRLAKEQEKQAKREAKLKAKQEKAILLQKKKEEAKRLKEKAKLEKQQLNLAKLKSQQQGKKLKDKEKLVNKKQINIKNLTTNEISNDEKKLAAKKSEDSKMIANLNIMAKKSIDLAQLMNKVAKNEANEKEVSEFRKIIEMAKKMPPPPGWIDPSITKIDQNSTKKVPIIEEKSKLPIEENGKEKEKGNVKLTEQSSEKNITEQSDEVVKTDIKEIEKNDSNITTTTTDEVTPVKSKRGRKKKNVTEVKEEQSGDEGVVIKKRPGRKPKIKDPNETEEEKLTAFQLKYLSGATLMLEFLEEKYIRYYIPKDSMIEYIEDKDEFLISFITIHNERDISRFAKRSKKPFDNEIYFLKNCPSPLFSTVTVTIKDIPKRFHPIVLNSPNKLENVQRFMKQILDIGTRLSGYNLWYQLDGYDDANLAEYYRVEANEYENGLKGRRARRSSSVNA